MVLFPCSALHTGFLQWEQMRQERQPLWLLIFQVQKERANSLPRELREVADLSLLASEWPDLDHVPLSKPIAFTYKTQCSFQENQPFVIVKQIFSLLSFVFKALLWYFFFKQTFLFCIVRFMSCGSCLRTPPHQDFFNFSYFSIFRFFVECLNLWSSRILSKERGFFFFFVFFCFLMEELIFFHKANHWSQQQFLKVIHFFLQWFEM